MSKQKHPIYRYLFVELLTICCAVSAQAEGGKLIRPVVKAATANAFAPQLER